ncbi:hypothetical protein OZN62_01290 [Aurantiacibacter sp. MUD11]|uniref:hypothetical protein n=1 Tax=Aurantiacibacter sp. MUD11 TaxID=3003265 RepID=UPI0022AA339C|nr:hypothetical protein [Aurantiacibacter sp. MUD11]WAT18239.1 hypothetical protein OZN62_01290 [Aurantiacibacter sp. MUD11]
MMKKIIASTLAAGLIAGTTMTAAAQTNGLRDAAPVAQAEEAGGEGDAGTILLILLAAAAVAGVIIAIEDGQDEPAPTSP